MCGGVRLFTRLWISIVSCPCFSYAEAWKCNVIIQELWINGLHANHFGNIILTNEIWFLWRIVHMYYVHYLCFLEYCFIRYFFERWRYASLWLIFSRRIEYWKYFTIIQEGILNLQSWLLALVNGMQVLDCFMEKSMFQWRYLAIIFVYPQYVKTYSHLFIALFYPFFAFTV